MQEFGHSGDFGDIIYALPTVRAAGGGVLYLFPFPGRTREQMTPERMEIIRGLLERQPYIQAVRFWPDKTKDHNLNGFRDHIRSQGNLVDAHLGTHGVDWLAREVAWIRIDDPISAAPVVFSRSPRYRNNKFPWRRIWERYGAAAIFIGSKDEYKTFCEEVGPIRHYPTGDLLEAARVIKGSELYVGNQSALLAIAEGLKHPLIAELNSGSLDNCCITRWNRINGYDERIELPTFVSMDSETPRQPAFAAKTIRVWGMRRSGHHAIAHWMACQFGDHCLFLNDVAPNGNPFRTFKPEPFSANSSRYYRVDRRSAHAWEYVPKRLLIYNLEDVPVTEFPTITREHSSHVGEAMDVLVLRDPFNMMASRKRSGMDHSDRTVMLWIEHAREAARITQHIPELVVANYNQWFTSQEYRETLAARLDIPFSDAGLNDVLHAGWGSSFDGRSFDGKASQMETLKRWCACERDASLRAALSSPEIGLLIAKSGMLPFVKESFEAPMPLS